MKGWKGAGESQIAGYYDLGETIGRGHFAVVKRAKHVFTGEVVATKVVDKTRLDEVARQHLYHEVRCMKLVQHPYVVRLYEVIDTKNKLYLIQEFGEGGDLFDYIVKKDNGLGEDVARKYFRQIVSAVAYCHRLHVVHRDLKPENVIFFPKLDVVKVTDFGFSNSFNPGDKLNTACGSLAYSAPEVLLGDAYDAVASDIWSLGVILYMLVVGRLPFSEANDSETLTKIMDCQYKIPNSLSLECQRLLKKLLVKEPQERISVDDILNDDWFGNYSHDDVIGVHPLLSRGELSEDERDHIIDIMVSGNIASRDEISRSLEESSYDHIAATFYLLAERHLSAMLARHVGLYGPAVVPARSVTASSSTVSVFSSRPNSGDNLLNNAEPSIKKSLEAMSAISEADGTSDSEREGHEVPHRFSVLIEEPYEDPDELPEIYEITEGVDDLELECRKASLTRLANIAEMSESDDALSSGRPSGRLSVGAAPSDSGPEQDARDPLDLGSPSVRPRSARSSWIGSRRSSGAALRSGSLSGRPPSLSRISATPSLSPFCRLTRSASSSDTSDIESESMSLSMNRNIARMKRHYAKPRNTCFRCDMDFPGSLAASLLLSNEPHRHHRRPSRPKQSVNRGGVESSDPATTSASDTEREFPFSTAAGSRCQSAAASVTFIVGAVNGDPQPVTENVVRRSSLPQSQVSSMRSCCQRAVEARTNFVPAVLQRVPFDQQQLPRSYRHALQMRLRHNYNHCNRHHHRFSTSSASDALTPAGCVHLTGRHSASLLEPSTYNDKMRCRKSVPPCTRIDEISSTALAVDSKVKGSENLPPVISVESNGALPTPVSSTSKDVTDGEVLPTLAKDSPITLTSEQTGPPTILGHASAPPTSMLSSSNRRHLPHNCELKPLHPLHLVQRSQRVSEFSVSTTSRGTGSDGSLPPSSEPSIRNGFKTPSVSSVRSDPDIFHYRHNVPTHCGSTVSAGIGGSCRTSRIVSRNVPAESSSSRKRSSDGEAAPSINNSSRHTPPPSTVDSENSSCRCGSIHHRKRGSSSSQRMGQQQQQNSNNCHAPHNESFRSNRSPVPESSPINGARLSDSSTPNRQKRNLLRSLFGQCFGCSLGNVPGTSSNTAGTLNNNSSSSVGKRKIKKKQWPKPSSQYPSKERRNSASSCRKKIDSGGLS